MSAQTTRDIADRHFAALASKDPEAVRRLLHDNLAFSGPLASLDTAEAYVQGIGHTMARLTGLERRTVVTSDTEAFQVYDAHFAGLDAALPLVEWLQVRDGRVAAITFFHDPRPLLSVLST